MTYIEEFKSVEDILSQYSIPESALQGCTIHLAWYGYGCYCGSSLVIFEKDGKLFEVNGSHCSCNGLEGQWEPEETSWQALQMRDLSGAYYDGEDDADKALKELCEAHS